MKGNALAETRLRVKERFEESFEGKYHHFIWPLQFCQRSFISLKGKCVLITSLCLAHHAWLNFKVRWTKKSSFVRTTTISISFCQLATVAKKQDNLPSLQNNYQFAKGSKFCPVSIFVSLRAESAVGVASSWDSRSKPTGCKNKWHRLKDINQIQILLYRKFMMLIPILWIWIICGLLNFDIKHNEKTKTTFSVCFF